jgi:hypothetical protein
MRLKLTAPVICGRIAFVIIPSGRRSLSAVCYAADTERAITRSIGSAQGAVTVSIDPNRLGHPALPKAIRPEEATIMLDA